MKGIILAGGLGSRLYPATLSCTKPILPIYDKPMIYYPLTTLIQAGIKEVLIISTPTDLPTFKRLLGDGSALGMKFSYAVEEKPRGIAPAFIIGEEFIGKDSVCLILSDNIFHGKSMPEMLKQSARLKKGCELYALKVDNPEKFGVIYEEKGKVVRIEEKPPHPTSNLAQTGLFFYDNSVVEVAKKLKPSARGEYEITDINNHYVKKGICKVNRLKSDVAWLDTGSHESLFKASQFVNSIQTTTNEFIACIEEEAYKAGFIGKEALLYGAEKNKSTAYGKHLKKLYDELGNK